MRRPNVGSLLEFAVLLALIVAWPLCSSAQAQAAAGLTPEAIAGKYQGTATSPGGERAIAADLKADKGALAGTIQAESGPVAVTGTVLGDKVTLSLEMGGSTATLTGTVKGDRIDGTWTLGSDSGTFTLKRAAADKPVSAEKAPAAPSAARPSEAPPAGDVLTGPWDGMTGNNDMSIAFNMNLKLDGDKVTGDISSDQGGAQFDPGTWKDGTLTITFEYPGRGTFTMVGSIKDGKLVGTIDMAGQGRMSWVAVKKAS